MAAPNPQALYSALQSLLQTISDAKQAAIKYRQLIASGMNRDQAFAFIDGNNRLQATLTSEANNLASAYTLAQVTYGQAAFAANIANTVAAAKACNDWIVANFPHDVNGWLLEEQFDANGNRVQRTFSAPQLAPLDALIVAFINTIG